jgi:hypothetical protein
MKMKTLLLYILAITLSTTSMAQKSLNSGTVKYNVEIESVKSGTSKMNNFGYTVYLAANKSRTDVVSTMGTESTVYDGTVNKGFILKEYSGQKLMITATKQNWLDKNKANNDLNFIMEEGTTVISGYTCKKASAVGQDGKKITVFFTTSVTLVNDNYNGSFPQLQGLPVKYEVSNGNLKLTYTLDTVSFDAVPLATFAAPTQGYRVMTYDENQQLKINE